MRALRYPGVFSGMRELLHWLNVERCGDRTIGILDAAREGDLLKPAGLPSRDIPPIIQTVIWFVLYIWFVWLNETNQMNEKN
jgi:hypothetical protein